VNGATYAPELETIANYGCDTTEGPLWHAAEQALYWLDIPPGRVYRYDPATGEHGLVHEAGEAIGGFTIQADGALLLFGDRGAIRRLHDGVVTPLQDEIPDERNSRFNDVIADPAGRVYAGTMPDGDRPGRLWRLDPDGSLHVALADAGLSNGMGFTPDLAAFYHTDSDKGTITRYPYDRATGELGPGETVVRIPAEAGVPDGMAVDEAGNLWSARWDGSALFHYAPDGTLLGSVAFPARKVASLAFGGPDFADAYVTCAGGGLGPEEGPAAGALIRTRLGVRGRPAFLSRVGI
jgi:sugar lactone lactonase YvrE